VRSLTILNAPQGPVSARLRREDPRQQAKSWYMLLFQFPGVAEAWLSAGDFANLRRFVFETAAPETFPPEDQKVFVEALARDSALTAALNYYRANMPPASWLRDPPDPPRIAVPTMIIWGEADAYMEPILLERSAATVDGPLRVERLPGVSHWVQQEVPDRVNELLLDFLAGLPG
jgi:pimeloyl-ACP methyl ester carboxylesterase